MRKSLKVLIALMGVLLLALAVAGCGGGGGNKGSTTLPATTPTKQYTVGSVIWNTSVPFYSNFIKGQKDTASKLGVKLVMENGNGELANEVAAIQRLISKHVDLILVTPSDAKGIVPAIRQANAAGIPVFAVNNRVDTSTGAKVVTYIGADDVTFGQRQGQLLVQAIGEKGTVALIQGKLGTSAQIDRKTGFMNYLKKYPGIKVVSQKSADWDNTKALAVTQDLLSRYPKGTLDAIVDQGPEGVTGAQWAHKQGRTDVKFLMGDYPAEVRNAILNGTVYGTVDQDPQPQGVSSIEMAQKWLQGKKAGVPTPHMYMPLPIVTQQNVDQYPAAWGAT
jgi:ribose transport system substrate-binding protein